MELPCLLVFFAVLIWLNTVSGADVLTRAKRRAPSSPIVEIPGLGKVVGDTDYSHFRKRTFYQYKGIRFGLPPTAERRYQPSEQPGPWNGTLDATKFGRQCPQPELGWECGWFSRPWAKLEYAAREELTRRGEVLTEPTPEDEDYEDCLFIHIYTPKLGVQAKLPVMVFIHGGAFVVGSALMYGPRRFMDKDVILVVPHYRLGPFGFLSLQTDSIPGNAAMLDQVLALEWVRDHISVFGGDPDLVTIFGESAGAGSVSYLMLSPLAKGLFHRVIAESGSALASWGIDNNPEFHTVNIAAEAGCNVTGADEGRGNLSEVTKCLKMVDAVQLLKASGNYKNKELQKGYNGFGGNSPVVQRAGKKKYITMPPLDIIKSGDYSNVPIMFGANRDEGTFLFSVMYVGYLVPNGLIHDKDFLSHGVPDSVLKQNNVKDPNYWLNDAIMNTYTTPEALKNFSAMCYGIADAVGALMLKGPQYHQVQLHSKRNNSYFYAFNFLGNSTMWSHLGVPGLPIEGGVCHMNELMFLFNIPQIELDEEEEDLSKKMIGIWTNFAIYGEPNPEGSKIDGVPKWLPYTYNDEFYMDIDRNITGRRDYTTEYTIGMKMHGI